MTETSGFGMNSPSAREILSRSCIVVRPEACTSCRSGSEILPSGRTGTTRDSVSFFQTETCNTSSGPITYSDEVALFCAAGGLGDACCATATGVITSAAAVARATDTTSHFTRVMWILLAAAIIRRPSPA